MNVGDGGSGATPADRRASYADARSSSSASSDSAQTLLPSPPGSATSTISMYSGSNSNSSNGPGSSSSTSRHSYCASSSSSLFSSSASPASAMTALTPNGKYYNPVVMSFIRDDWIQQQLHLRQSAYTAFQQTTVVAGTWNVNAKKPLSQGDSAKILQWILAQQQQGTTSQACVFPDIVALGFQEIVDLNAVNVVVNSTLSAQRSSAWEDSILTALNSQSPAHQYKVVMEKHLVGIMLVVFVKSEHAEHVKEVHGATAGVGIMGMMGNKGGAAIRMNYYDSTLCFVCAHLAAHRENVAGRNADYLNILSKIEFRDSENECYADDIRHLSGEPHILNHDFVFWIGDLNYRINEEIPVEAVFQQAESGMYSELLQLDQLNIERKRKNVFRGFEEGRISFPPTYKFQAGTMMYEKRPEKKLRAPAWCDRVLWRAKIPDHIVQQSYTAVMKLDLSDHKPVRATFEVQIRHQVEAKKTQVVREIMMQLDKWENENMPKVRLVQSDGVQLSSGVLGFAHLKYGIDQTKTLYIENTGVVVAHFRFIPKLEEVLLCKPWLSVSPTFGMIPPKERIEIRITAHVDESVAHGLTSGEESLDDTMILRVENGRDYFLVVSGQYDNSCFGNSLEQLVLNSEPVRRVNTPYANSAGAAMFSVAGGSSPPASIQNRTTDDSLSPNKAQQKIPKELWRMVNDIYQNFMKEKNLFVEAGDKQQVPLLREALDTGNAFPNHSGYSTAELLLCWLQSLRQSVIPDESLATALASGNGNLAQTCRALLDSLPPVRFNVLIYLVSFLKEVLKHSSSNKLTPEKLAFVFSRCLVSQYRVPKDLNLVQTLSDSQTPLHFATAPTAPSGSNQTSILPEEKLRRSAREIEAAQLNAVQRAERMERMLVHLITTNTL